MAKMKNQSTNTKAKAVGAVQSVGTKVKAAIAARSVAIKKLDPKASDRAARIMKAKAAMGAAKAAKVGKRAKVR